MRHSVQFTLSLSACFGILATACTSPTPAKTPAHQSAEAATANTSPAIQTTPKLSIALPETDAGLPGSGPIRRADWFKKVWNERRSLWLRTAEADTGAIVFLGDSITQQWGDTLGGSLPEYHVANRGIGGDTSRGVLIRLEQDVIALKPKAVVLLIGTNDIEENAAPRIIASNVELIVQALEKAQPAIRILLCEVFPSSATMRRPATTIRELNGLYGALAARDPHITLVRTWSVYADDQGDAKASEFPDLLHPNAAGYAKFAQVLKPVLAKVAAGPEKK